MVAPSEAASTLNERKMVKHLADSCTGQRK